MKIYKITEASEYLGVSINTLKTLANNEKIKSFKTTGEHRRFRQEDLDAYMGVEKDKQEKLTVIYARCSTAKQKENLEEGKYLMTVPVNLEKCAHVDGPSDSCKGCVGLRIDLNQSECIHEQFVCGATFRKAR